MKSPRKIEENVKIDDFTDFKNVPWFGAATMVNCEFIFAERDFSLIPKNTFILAGYLQPSNLKWPKIEHVAFFVHYLKLRPIDP